MCLPWTTQPHEFSFKNKACLKTVQNLSYRSTLLIFSITHQLTCPWSSTLGSLYTVAWIAPRGIEARAALHTLDNCHKGQFPWSHGYNYLFHAGDINRHNVIIATLPAGGSCGIGSAAALASQIKTFFPNIRFGLLVGIAWPSQSFPWYPPWWYTRGSSKRGKCWSDCICCEGVTEILQSCAGKSTNSRCKPIWII